MQFKIIAILAWLTASSCLATAWAAEGLSSKANEYIIKIKSGPTVSNEGLRVAFEKSLSKNRTAVHEFFNQNGIMAESGAVQRTILHQYQEGSLANLLHVRLNKADLATFKQEHGQDIEYIEPNYIISIPGHKSTEKTSNVASVDPEWVWQEDLLLTQALYSVPTSQWGLSYVNAQNAWAMTSGHRQVVVAVIDSGVDYNHPALQSNIWINVDEIEGNGIDDDQNGYVDDIMGWDFANNDARPSDGSSHGTHVAGTIAANSAKAMGIAPDVQIMPLQFLGADGNGTTAAAIKAIDYAIGKKVKIINNSWGGGGYSVALYDAIKSAQAAGALFVVAAGNSGDNTDSKPTYPANYTLNNIISVASVTSTGALSSFSNYGAASVDLGAPGSNIYSTLPNSGYGQMSGTSMASPFVAGIAALVWSQHPNYTWSQVKAALLNSGRSLASLKGKCVTGKVVDAEAALNAPNDEEEPTLPTPTPKPISFDPTQITLSYSVYRPYSIFSSKREVTLTLKSDVKAMLDQIQSVTYNLQSSSVSVRTTTNRSDSFKYKFASRKGYSYQLITTITLRDGQQVIKNSKVTVNR